MTTDTGSIFDVVTNMEDDLEAATSFAKQLRSSLKRWAMTMR
jgi:hypothetical protein